MHICMYIYVCVLWIYVSILKINLIIKKLKRINFFNFIRQYYFWFKLMFFIERCNSWKLTKYILVALFSGNLQLGSFFSIYFRMLRHFTHTRMFLISGGKNMSNKTSNDRDGVWWQIIALYHHIHSIKMARAVEFYVLANMISWKQCLWHCNISLPVLEHHPNLTNHNI